MKKLIILLSLGIVFSAHAKSNVQLDTLYANSKMITALFFPADIRQAISGSDNFVFTYNREKEQNLGLLKAVKGNPSNLLVITTDGKIYSYILKYSELLENPNRFITSTESIGNAKRTKEKKVDAIKTPIKSISDINSQNLLRKSCESLLKLPEEKNIKKTTNNIKLSLKNLKYHQDNVYLQFQIENKSGITFNIDSFQIFKTSGNKKNKSSYQKQEIKPVYIYKLPNTVLYGEQQHFVCVLPKFILNKNEQFITAFYEFETSRQVSFKFRKLY